MAGKIVKTKSGKTGTINNDDKPVIVEVMDNRNPFMAQVRQVKKIKVILDDGSKILCDPLSLEFIGFWD